MSFVEQERVLFDLLFDQRLRDQFCSDPALALTAYELSPSEREDFNRIRPDALQLDAMMRADLILSHLCRSFPLSFSLFSSLPEGLDLLRALIDTRTMQTTPRERSAAFGIRMREALAACAHESEHEKAMLLAILEVETGMAWTSASLKQVVLEKKPLPPDVGELPTNWQQQPVRLADFVSVALIPHSYAQLKQVLCACEDGGLWRHLTRSPLTATQRRELLASEQPRLLVSRALLARASACEPVIEHQTVELSEGFAPLFQHINGAVSIQQLMHELEKIGAPSSILLSVRDGFQQLLSMGFLTMVYEPVTSS